MPNRLCCQNPIMFFCHFDSMCLPISELFISCVSSLFSESHASPWYENGGLISPLGNWHVTLVLVHLFHFHSCENMNMEVFFPVCCYFHTMVSCRDLFSTFLKGNENKERKGYSNYRCQIGSSDWAWPIGSNCNSGLPLTHISFRPHIS